jgi:hypothetical protein
MFCELLNCSTWGEGIGIAKEQVAFKSLGCS